MPTNAPHKSHRSSHLNVKRDMTLENQWHAKNAEFEARRAAVRSAS
jgi:hypothetical protein